VTELIPGDTLLHHSVGGSDAVREAHVIEAIGYRSRDRKLWAK
jgi:hypothetical protein